MEAPDQEGGSGREVPPSDNKGSENARRGTVELRQVASPKEMASTLGSGLECEFGLSLPGWGPDQVTGVGLGQRVQEWAALAVSEHGTLGATESKNPGN